MPPWYAHRVTFTFVMAGVQVKAQCIILFAKYEATVTIERNFLRLYRKEIYTFQTYSSLFSRSKEIEAYRNKNHDPDHGSQKRTMSGRGLPGCKVQRTFLVFFCSVIC
jgi:hypothetical protein